MFDEVNEIKIAQAQELFHNMQAEKEKYEKLSDLTFKDWVETVKREVHYEDYIFLGNSAQKWTWMLKNEKIDKRRKYSEKEAYDLLIEKIKEELVPVDFEIVQFSNQYGVDVKFKIPTLKQREFELHIPDTRNLTHGWFYEAGCGKIRITVCYNNSCCWELLTSSYHRKEIKKEMENYLKPQEIWK